MTTIAYNIRHGGFSLSDEALEMLLDRKGIPWVKVKSKYGGMDYFRADGALVNGVYSDDSFLSEYDFTVDRSDEDLIYAIKTLGKEAEGPHCWLATTELPAGTKYVIQEYDGWEEVKTIDEFDWLIA